MKPKIFDLQDTVPSVATNELYPKQSTRGQPWDRDTGEHMRGLFGTPRSVWRGVPDMGIRSSSCSDLILPKVYLVQTKNIKLSMWVVKSAPAIVAPKHEYGGRIGCSYSGQVCRAKVTKRGAE